MNTKIKEIIDTMDADIIEKYSLGPLLYSPGTSLKIFDKIKYEAWSKPFSIALCLEDAIADEAVEFAEKNVVDVLTKIHNEKSDFSYIPKIFIRVRSPKQIGKLFSMLSSAQEMLEGFILPKFSPLNAQEYIKQMKAVNKISLKKVYFMPILESADLIPLTTRAKTLEEINKILIPYKDLVLNIRVGGNDLCNHFGLRRNANETIYDIRPIANIFSDIITVFYNDFVISGPVWEYFADENTSWKTGLEKEIRMDILNGFTAKTIIHPSQIDVVNNALKTNPQDIEDAINILSFKSDIIQVIKSSAGTRMNEIKTHTAWAKKQVILSYIYGVR